MPFSSNKSAKTIENGKKLGKIWSLCSIRDGVFFWYVDICLGYTIVHTYTLFKPKKFSWICDCATETVENSQS